MPKKLVIASHNQKKAGEMLQILGSHYPELEIRTLADYPDAPEPDETGLTYAENALIKVRSALAATNEWALADDAGLEVDHLGGRPGLHSKRYGGEDLPFLQKIELLLSEMRGVPNDLRTARFRCCIALASPEGNEYLFEATCEGRIHNYQAGEGGFGYDSIFYLPDQGCTMAQLTAEEKHAISHRGKVLRALQSWMLSKFGSGALG